MKKALRLAYRNKSSLSFEDLLKKDETANIPKKSVNISKEIYKAKNNT